MSRAINVSLCGLSRPVDKPGGMQTVRERNPRLSARRRCQVEGSTAKGVLETGPLAQGVPSDLGMSVGAVWYFDAEKMRSKWNQDHVLH